MLYSLDLMVLMLLKCDQKEELYSKMLLTSVLYRVLSVSIYIRSYTMLDKCTRDRTLAKWDRTERHKVSDDIGFLINLHGRIFKFVLSIHNWDQLKNVSKFV